MTTTTPDEPHWLDTDRIAFDGSDMFPHERPIPDGLEELRDQLFGTREDEEEETRR